MLALRIFKLYSGAKVIHIRDYVKYPTFYYKMGFVLDDFAQLLANLSVPSMVKVGWTSCEVRWVRCIRCILTYGGCVCTEPHHKVRNICICSMRSHWAVCVGQ